MRGQAPLGHPSAWLLAGCCPECLPSCAFVHLGSLLGQSVLWWTVDRDHELLSDFANHDRQAYYLLFSLSWFVIGL